MAYVNGVWQDDVNTPDAPANPPVTQSTTPEQGVLSNIEQAYEAPTQPQTPDFGSYDAQGVSNSIDNQVDIKSGSDYVTSDSLVEDRLTSLLDSNSKYIQQARNSAAEQSQERGLSNTSVAAGAGEAAAIQEGLSIATPDALTYSKTGQLQQSKENEVEFAKSQAIISSGMVDQEAKIQSIQQNVQNTFKATMAKADTESKVWLTELQNTYATTAQDLKYQTDKLLADAQYDAVTKEGVRTATSSVMQNYQITIETLMTNPDLIELGKNTMNTYIETARVLAKNSIKFIGASNGVDDLDTWADQYFTEFV